MTAQLLIEMVWGTKWRVPEKSRLKVPSTLVRSLRCLLRPGAERALSAVAWLSTLHFNTLLPHPITEGRCKINEDHMAEYKML